VWRSWSRNSQQCLRISLDLEAMLDVRMGRNLALYVFWMMNRMHTIPDVDITFAEFCMRLMTLCMRASRNRSTRCLSCCDM